MTRFLIGIDEAGRGPLAGPVAVGVVKIPRENMKYFRGVKDSKQLSEKQREVWLRKIQKLSKEGKLEYSVSFSSAEVIDKKGIVKAISLALARSLRKLVPLAKEKFVEVLLDGSLKAPSRFSNQKTIIRGDEKRLVIALASILAKVLRDRMMKRFAKKYPKFSFEIHKGYGTLSHRKSIRKYGPSKIHRGSFLQFFRGIKK
ncbi:MAG: ribonuclease HII [Patescibacteria group bacterium]